MLKLSMSFIMMLCFHNAAAQKISGTITDGKTGEPLIGAVVFVKGTQNASVTDVNGKFEISADSTLPLILVFTLVGYEQQEVSVKSFDKPLKVKLAQKQFILKNVDIVESRITEKQKQSALTVETMDLIAIRECPAVNFYEGLSSLKGVDLTSASIGFKIINTRGFNSTSPVRSLQIIDGVDNQAPGLNFSLGNFLGASELDVLKVDLVAGASSAFYGPNAFNGVISMTTRSPFVKPGIEVLSKVGERGLFENAVRWAQVFKNKKGEDKFGYKINFFYMQARDWEANNMDSTQQSLSAPGNPGGYDAVNVYGDEYNAIGNFTVLAGLRPGLGIYYRTGYAEKDIADYNTENIKAGAALHYKLKPETEIIYALSYGAGTTIYQGDNRYSLKDIHYYQNRIELKKKDKYFLRAYATNEDAGKSYDVFFTALLLQNAVKKDQHWYTDYSSYWASEFNNRIFALPGFPSPPGPPEQWADYVNSINPFLLNNYYDTLTLFHSLARAFADGVGNPINLSKPFLAPGTPGFDSAFAAITSSYSFSQGGSRFYDKSALYHVHGEYIFNLPFADVTTGGNFRMYVPDSRGTIFNDTGSVKIQNREYGFYAGAEKKMFNKKLTVNVAARLDKNENFDYLISPAASAVYTLNTNHFLRLSFSSAIRNPTLSDQYLYYNVGRATLLGNISGFDSLVTIPSLLVAFSSSRDSLKYFNVPPIRPEKVQTIEVGYRANLFKNIFVDAGYYYSFYRDFIGYKVGAKVRPTLFLLYVDSIYRVSANAEDVVTTQGFSIGINYYFKKYFSFFGNYSWNTLDRHGSTDPLIPAFNTPEHKYNIGLSGRDINFEVLKKIRFTNYGFSINYKWIQGFQFEGSPQFTGYVPTYDIVDAQISKRVPKIFCTFKLGASNLLNKFTYQVYGGPYVGRLAYFSVLFEPGKKI